MTQPEKNNEATSLRALSEENGKNLIWLRIIGFIFLLLIATIIFLLFQFPQILNGPMGMFIPVALFVFLFAAFYSLIISLKI